MSFFLIALKVVCVACAAVVYLAFARTLWIRSRHTPKTKGLQRPWERAVASLQPRELPPEALAQVRRAQGLGLNAAMFGFLAWALAYLIERAARN